MEICSPTGLGACRRPVCCHWGALPVPAGRLLVALLSALERFVSLATHDRIAVLDAYSRRCAITGERSLSVIEASHIQLFARGGQHAVRNGLPLRPDIHRLFDLGYVGVRPNHSFAVSPALRDQYENGRVSTNLTVARYARRSDQLTVLTQHSWSGTTRRSTVVPAGLAPYQPEWPNRA